MLPLLPCMDLSCCRTGRGVLGLDVRLASLSVMSISFLMRGAYIRLHARVFLLQHAPWSWKDPLALSAGPFKGSLIGNL
jgi:hypothetical protein